MTVRNDTYDFKGYLNNLRIVKGSSLDSDSFGSLMKFLQYLLATMKFTLMISLLEELLEYGAATAKGIRGTVFTNNGLALSEGSGYAF